MPYKHTQIGHLIISILIILIVYFGFILKQTGFEPNIYIIIILIILLLASFVSLTVIIDEKYLKIKFGYGIHRRNFVLKEISSVKIVKNHWYYGWGIRIWYWPYMMIFNVSGFDAVEIKMQDNKIYRIGTDEPQKLEQAISQVIG
jgi:hypothetical protein